MPGGNCPPGIFFAISASCSGDGIPEPKPIAFASPASGPRFAPPIIFGSAVASGGGYGAALMLLTGCALAYLVLGTLASAAALRLQGE